MSEVSDSKSSPIPSPSLSHSPSTTPASNSLASPPVSLSPSTSSSSLLPTPSSPSIPLLPLNFSLPKLFSPLSSPPFYAKEIERFCSNFDTISFLPFDGDKDKFHAKITNFNSEIDKNIKKVVESNTLSAVLHSEMQREFIANDFKSMENRLRKSAEEMNNLFTKSTDNMEKERAKLNLELKSQWELLEKTHQIEMENVRKSVREADWQTQGEEKEKEKEKEKEQKGNGEGKEITI